MSTRATRCDQIIALIDACLADVGASACGPFGAEGPPTERASRHPGPRADR